MPRKNQKSQCLHDDDDFEEEELKHDEIGAPAPLKRSGRKRIKIEYIEDKNRRHITFSKRKAGIMKKAYELSTLTGTQVLLLIVSETGLVYTFTTPKLQPMVTKPEGKNLIQACLNSPDPEQTNIESPRPSASVVKTKPPVGWGLGNELCTDLAEASQHEETKQPLITQVTYPRSLPAPRATMGRWYVRSSNCRSFHKRPT
ncbi:hypothetical protein BX666DRAFT_1987523 [Dichotomocladium elegans]|nr:hypothetical protein BX666DRAFT_1987523 [Dichotomocladium elegans]